jgi:hypothetical protein
MNGVMVALRSLRCGTMGTEDILMNSLCICGFTTLHLARGLELAVTLNSLCETEKKESIFK